MNKKRKTSKRSLHHKTVVHAEKDLLKEALKDLDRELAKLRVARIRLQKDLNSISSELGDAERKENSLREKVATLMKKEAELSKKKGILKEKIVSCDQRIEKVKAIEKGLQAV